MTSKYKINSRKLLDLEKVKLYGKNINFIFSSNLSKGFINKFPGYYVFEVKTKLVEEVYNERYFFKNKSKSFDANKWKSYIEKRKQGNITILDAHDYNGAIWKYLVKSNEKYNIKYYGDLFWIFHDLGHIYLNHSYNYGTFMHRAEMDASLFAVIKLLQLNIFNENEVLKLVYRAIKPLLKSGKYINKDDYKYFIIQMNYFKALIKKNDLSKKI